MDTLVRNGGFQRTALHIFGLLDPRSIGECRLVSSHWRKLIDSQKFWWVLQVQDLKTKRVFPTYDVEEAREKENTETIIDYYPHWKDVFEYYEKIPSIAQTNNFLQNIRLYFRKNKSKDKHLVQCPLLDAIKTQNIDFLRNLQDCPSLDFNAPFRYPFVKPHYGYTDHERFNPIHWACRYAKMKVLKFFIHDCGQDVDLNRRTPDILILLDKKFSCRGLTPFLVACLFGQVGVAKYLLSIAQEFGINVKASDLMANTALNIAVSSENIKMVKFVLNHRKSLDIDVNAATTFFGLTAFHIACGGLDCTSKPWLDAIKDLGYKYAILDVASPLSRDFMDVSDGKYKCLRYLFDVYDEIAVNAQAFHGETPLHCAAWKLDPVIVNMLLKSAPRLGIDIDKTNNDSQTPADVAKEIGFFPIVQLFNLYERGLLRTGNVAFVTAILIIFLVCFLFCFFSAIFFAELIYKYI